MSGVARPKEGLSLLPVLLAVLLLVAMGAVGAYFFYPSAKAWAGKLPWVGRYLGPPAAQAPAATAPAGESLEQERQALNRAEADLQAREGQLKLDQAALEQAKKGLAAQQAAVKSQQDQLQAASVGVARLARIYEGMKPAEASAIMGNLDDQTLLGVLAAMDDVSAAKVLAAMDPTQAARLTRLLATRPPPSRPQTAQSPSTP